MKKVLLVVAMLLAASQVMAGVTITAVNEGTYTTSDGNAAHIRIGYVSTLDVRAFALNLTVDNGCTFWNIRDFNVGENDYPNKANGYGIFPSRFRSFINPQNPQWGDANANSNYNPLTAWGEPGATNTGYGFPTAIVEMGYLGATDANKPALSGTLFRIDINAYALAGTATITITADAMRGGIVAKDTNATTTETNLPVTLAIPFPVGPSCIVPSNQVGQTPAVACAAWVGQTLVCGTGTPVVDCVNLGKVISHDTACVPTGTAVNYTYGVAPAEPNVKGMTRANAKAALTNLGFVVSATEVNVPGDGTVAVGSVWTQNPVAGTTGCGTTVTLSIVSYPIKAMTVANSLYVNWLAVGKPQCWAFPRQCHGDADGKKLGTLWVSTNDLTILKAAISKNPPPSYCADFDHKKLGTLWVSTNDLAILKAYISKAEASVPVCGTPGLADPNYWYFCVPTGVACPAGVTCAPAGVCPNTP